MSRVDRAIVLPAQATLKFGHFFPLPRENFTSPRTKIRFFALMSPKVNRSRSNLVRTRTHTRGSRRISLQSNIGRISGGRSWVEISSRPATLISPRAGTHTRARELTNFQTAVDRPPLGVERSNKHRHARIDVPRRSRYCFTGAGLFEIWPFFSPSLAKILQVREQKSVFPLLCHRK